jgi:hypothetical protein
MVKIYSIYWFKGQHSSKTHQTSVETRVGQRNRAGRFDVFPAWNEGALD